MTRVTPDDVRRTRFGHAPFGHHGYHPARVDAFCARIADTMLGRDHLTIADIRLIEFDAPPPDHRGYDIDQVDDFLDQVCMELEYLRQGSSAGRAHDPLTPDDVLRIQFSAPPYGLPGYHAKEVGAFLDRLAATLAHHGPSGLTPEDVRDITFHLAPEGVPAYHREEVDAFLDLVVHQLENSEARRC
ncbi:DivIVA domain-containing protein [Nocardia aurantiaca]|uniref:Cell wall synthesis protein Wag31 n=1 Tax=Nocardia aurantiaca TaxID=2675850 RepID=A0A6I3KVU3_9NOCA|nr:DivIVA domain-containing protein [Nocardia aurantiaca]MTE14943.1 DivIVA domain-containing protein [Nocardia aurantiaca]